MYETVVWQCFRNKKGPASCSPRGHRRRCHCHCLCSSQAAVSPENATEFSAIVPTLYVSISFVQILMSIVRAYCKYQGAICMREDAANA